MAVLGPVAVDDRRGGARRWGVPATVAPCPATGVPMVVVPPTPNLGVMATVIANDALQGQGMEAGNSRVVVIDPAIGLASVPVIDPVIG